MAYVQKTDIENYLGITIDDSLDAFIAMLIEATEDYIERLCGGGVVGKRWFDDDDSAKTFVYDGANNEKLIIDDLRTLTSLTVSDGTGTTPVTLVNGTDFYLYPINAGNYGEPYTQVQLIQPSTRLNLNSRLATSSPYVFDEGQKTITIVGKFGYSTTVPAIVKVAVLRIVGTFIKDNIGDTSLREQTSETLGEYSAGFAKISDVADRLGITQLLDAYVRKQQTKASGMRTI